MEKQGELVQLVKNANNTDSPNIEIKDNKIINVYDNATILDLEKAKTLYIDDGSKTDELKQTITNVFEPLKLFDVGINFGNYQEGYKFQEGDIIFINVLSPHFASQLAGQADLPN